MKIESSFAPAPVRIAHGVAGSVVGAVVDSVGLGGATLIHTPRAVTKAYCDLWSSEKTLAYKASASLIIPAAAALATPLAAGLGFVAGAYEGARDGYQNGAASAAEHSVDFVMSYDQFLTDTLKG